MSEAIVNAVLFNSEITETEKGLLIELLKEGSGA